MSRYRRSTTGTSFFFTVVSYRRRPILCDPPIRAALREAIQAVRLFKPFVIDGWVLMPDHLHCIWTLPTDDTDFSQRWSQIKHRVTYACGDRYRMRQSVAGIKRGDGTIWQRRFIEHRIRNDVDMQRHLDYIHFNPVKHGYVSHAHAWPYSTFGRYVQAGVYARDWGGGPELEQFDFE
jgi:putative transposase